jgi:pimeloyl-ACP methyl ester carboxylesterase
MASETDACIPRFLIGVACAQARSIASRVHRLRWGCSVLLLTTSVVLLVIDLSGCAEHRLPGGLSKLKWCRLAGIDEQLLCGKIRVFENRRTRIGRTIDLNIVVLPALDQKTKTEPVFDLAGGPGVASTSAAAFYATEGKEYRRRHDVVLVDQRGTGNSNRLAIPQEKTPESDLREMYSVDYVIRMRDALQKHADLTQYTTSIAMDDLDDVRAWLGYNRVNLFGLSYGTRAALVYLRQHPKHVRTITLFGVAPTYLRMPMWHAQSAERAMDLLLSECEQDEVCHAAFPQIREDWKKVLTDLQRAAGRVEYKPDNRPPTSVEIQRDIFAEKIRNFLYARDQASRIPLLIHRAAKGDFQPFLHEAIGSSLANVIADGMYLCVTCAEDVPFIDQAEATKLNADNPFGNYRVLQQTRACSMWPRGEIPADYREAVRSDVPALIFSGNLDPVTPPQRGEEVARYLSNSRHVIIPEAGHGPFGLTNAGCLDELIIQFMNTANAKSLDVSCVGRMARPPFLTK